MKTTFKSLLMVLLILPSTLAFCQADINTEKFRFEFKPNSTGGQIVYHGKSHAFTFDIIGKDVKESEVKGKAENQNFINLGKAFIQASWVAIPQPLPASINLGNLTIDQQKEILTGYVNYELEYFTKELKVKAASIKKEWCTLNSKLFLVWYFDMKPLQQGADDAHTVTGQVYLTTICFNETLNLNTAREGKTEFEEPINWLKTVAGTIKLYNTSLPVK